MLEVKPLQRDYRSFVSSYYNAKNSNKREQPQNSSTYYQHNTSQTQLNIEFISDITIEASAACIHEKQKTKLPLLTFNKTSTLEKKEGAEHTSGHHISPPNTDRSGSTSSRQRSKSARSSRRDTVTSIESDSSHTSSSGKGKRPVTSKPSFPSARAKTQRDKLSKNGGQANPEVFVNIHHPVSEDNKKKSQPVPHQMVNEANTIRSPDDVSSILLSTYFRNDSNAICGWNYDDIEGKDDDFQNFVLSLFTTETIDNASGNVLG